MLNVNLGEPTSADARRRRPAWWPTHGGVSSRRRATPHPLRRRTEPPRAASPAARKAYAGRAAFAVLAEGFGLDEIRIDWGAFDASRHCREQRPGQPAAGRPASRGRSSRRTTPMWMAGYASRTEPAEGKLHDLWAKALALEDAAGKRVVLVTLDVCGIDRELSTASATGSAAVTGLGRRRRSRCRARTPTRGPMVGDNLPAMNFARRRRSSGSSTSTRSASKNTIVHDRRRRDELDSRRRSSLGARQGRLRR